MGSSDSVEISIVSSGRNDNWNGSFDRVAPFVVAHNAAVLSKVVERFELVFVEWAPLENRPFRSQRLAMIAPQVRCLVVPRAVHDGFRPGIPFLQYHARNAGIRRARGRRIAALNADILLTPEIVQAMLSLAPGTCLRAPRYDVCLAVLDQTGSDDVLRFCEDPANRVAEHHITRRFGDRVFPWFENAAGDFACMHSEDWQRVGGFHQRVDASMGVDAELIGQVRRMYLTIEACERPVYHVDHPEQQRGRLHMPPYSDSGYENPNDWGLGGADFSIGDGQVRCCPPGLAGESTRVDWPPILPWPEDFDGLANLHDRGLTRRYHSVVFCGLCDALLGLAVSLDLRPGQARVWDDGESQTAARRREFGWREWPCLRPEPGVLFIALEGTPVENTLINRGAVLGEDLLAVDPSSWRTFSPLYRALSICAADRSTIVLLGFAEPGRLIADWLGRQHSVASEIRVWDDAPAARSIAQEKGLPLIEPDQLVGAAGGQMIIITADPKAAGRIFADRLRSRGLVEWHDWIARPFYAASRQVSAMAGAIGHSA
jgi:hypothetical protein